jgi:hypothetical protein
MYTQEAACKGGVQTEKVPCRRVANSIVCRPAPMPAAWTFPQSQNMPLCRLCKTCRSRAQQRRKQEPASVRRPRRVTWLKPSRATQYEAIAFSSPRARLVSPTMTARARRPSASGPRALGPSTASAPRPPGSSLWVHISAYSDPNHKRAWTSGLWPPRAASDQPPRPSTFCCSRSHARVGCSIDLSKSIWDGFDWISFGCRVGFSDLGRL